ncbi:hypothetical protein N9M65_01865 [Luminiphilus sp.]|nr:hypothetical protein [Luminiphilus sp.]
MTSLTSPQRIALFSTTLGIIATLAIFATDNTSGKFSHEDPPLSPEPISATPAAAILELSDTSSSNPAQDADANRSISSSTNIDDIMPPFPLEQNADYHGFSWVELTSDLQDVKVSIELVNDANSAEFLGMGESHPYANWKRCEDCYVDTSIIEADAVNAYDESEKYGNWEQSTLIDTGAATDMGYVD